MLKMPCGSSGIPSDSGRQLQSQNNSENVPAKTKKRINSVDTYNG